MSNTRLRLVAKTWFFYIKNPAFWAGIDLMDDFFKFLFEPELEKPDLIIKMKEKICNG